MSSLTKMGGGVTFFCIWGYMLYFQNPKRIELQVGIILKLKHQGKTLRSFIEIAFIGGKIQPIEYYQGVVVVVMVAAAPVVVVPPYTKSMGKWDFGGLLLIKSSHLCNHWGYRHGVGLNISNGHQNLKLLLIDLMNQMHLIGLVERTILVLNHLNWLNHLNRMFRYKVMAFSILDFYVGLLEHFKKS